MSEIKGLTQDSVSDGFITIKQVCVNVNGSDIIKNQAKQFTRNRKHKIPSYIQSLIANVSSDFLVPISGKMINYKFSKILKDNDLPHMSFHDLRHVNASVMAMLQVPDKYAQERGGWKTDAVMKKVYTHTFSKERQIVDQQIDSFFDNIIHSDISIDLSKYKSWLVLFEKEDNEQSLQAFKAFMQH